MFRQLFPAEPYPYPHPHTHTDPRSTQVFAFVMLICLICIIALPIPRTIIIITIVFFVYADKKFHSQFELLPLLLFGERTWCSASVCVCECECVLRHIVWNMGWLLDLCHLDMFTIHPSRGVCVCLSNMQNVVINITENAENWKRLPDSLSVSLSACLSVCLVQLWIANCSKQSHTHEINKLPWYVPYCITINYIYNMHTHSYILCTLRRGNREEREGGVHWVRSHVYLYNCYARQFACKVNSCNSRTGCTANCANLAQSAIN